uniref:GDP-fucose protein O-fucosyltransferase 1 n=1 Tax=Parastrongyloides trichosuri TaxID=131310 RepID=A0A0N4ZJV4_PARTI
MLRNILFFLFIYLNILISGHEGDPNGYIAFCPCMGRFGNQMEQFLGALSFSKLLNRTLILPPLVEYLPGKPSATMVDFESYFQIKPLEEYHRVISMRKFMKDLSKDVWPEDKRFAFCWAPKNSIFDDKLPAGCQAKEGNPFGPFWDNFNIQFVGDVYYGDIPNGYIPSTYKEVEEWKSRFPENDYPVLSFTSAPGQFPARHKDRRLQRYIRWSSRITSQAKKFIDQYLPRPFVGIHLRNDVDWKRVCEHVEADPSRTIFSSEQCTGINNEKGQLTKESCFPSYETILHDVEKLVRENNMKAVFVSSDKDHMIEEINERLKTYDVKAYKLNDNNPHVSLAILQASNHFIGNCVSTFTAFATRSREFSSASSNRPTTFFGFSPSIRKRKIEL